ncbi:hypothetical protein [Paraburkholderia sp. NMBU_R16]|nr:hypothetical protein [Paraburkholderia sp. NMBU_R16]
MKYLLIVVLSSPVLLAYHLKPEEMQEAALQAPHFVLHRLAP